jgi:hypothetical protein
MRQPQQFPLRFRLLTEYDPMSDYHVAGPTFFLRKKLHLYLTLAVIATTLFSWFNINSYLIILLLLCRCGMSACALL